MVIEYRQGTTGSVWKLLDYQTDIVAAECVKPADKPWTPRLGAKSFFPTPDWESFPVVGNPEEKDNSHMALAFAKRELALVKERIRILEAEIQDSDPYYQAVSEYADLLAEEERLWAQERATRDEIITAFRADIRKALDAIRGSY